ncbi:MULTISPECIES: hypothetical protein [Sporosarcina]|uniref:hypothetical protein n=1 Tax=Sporosarcina TaxID=1569 RepID=UPI00078CBFA7|nr:hypothetical protein [Sporosarcina psychrophila]AMQ07047.1 hypothetical protein AZE41_14510 [Sporosarcina psychrophila]
MKNNLIALSIFCLALSFMIGSWLITNELRENSTSVKEVSLKTEKEKEVIKPQFFNKSELAIYLGLSEEDVSMLGPIPSGENSTSSELPYIQINGTLYFSKQAIDKWLQNHGSFSVTR